MQLHSPGFIFCVTFNTGAERCDVCHCHLEIVKTTQVSWSVQFLISNSKWGPFVIPPPLANIFKCVQIRPGLGNLCGSQAIILRPANPPDEKNYMDEYYMHFLLKLWVLPVPKSTTLSAGDGKKVAHHWIKPSLTILAQRWKFIFYFFSTKVSHLICPLKFDAGATTAHNSMTTKHSKSM